ncbi:MAG: protein kinase domain-containing protein [Thermodesulfobacteriota bacterium]
MENEFFKNHLVSDSDQIYENREIQENSIRGYKITGLIHYGNVSKVLKAIDTKKNRRVIIKILNEDSCTPLQVSKLRQDFEIRQHIDSECISKALKFAFYYNRPYIVMDDFGGICLNSFIKDKKTDTETFFTIAEKCLHCLDVIHQNDIIHKDIKPCNILYNPDSAELKFTDFGISTMLGFEHPSLLNPKSLEGTIAFISPEQTGRMNRFLDYRTDYYSLGITFYYLLTGTIPFNDSSPMRMVHSHLAKKPVPVFHHDQTIPEALSDIVMKLMEKNPEDRYQSIQGILYDLRLCRSGIIKNKKLSYFTAGQKDISEKFRVPEKLYGRKNEINALKEAFWRSQDGSSEIVMVSGYSGSGKTALINEMKKEISEINLFFISGKFDQYNRKEAYSGIIQAFEKLIAEILGEPDEKIEYWKEKILEATGENTKIITNLIPRLELITGKQPDPPQYSVSEARSRFNYTFMEFIKVFARKEDPLVLFLDDMQWIDSASLGLLKSLIVNSEIKHFLIAGAYRNNETDQNHPLSIFLKDIKNRNLSITEIETAPLTFKDTLDIISETFLTDKSKIYKFGELIYKKTGANPYFIKEFLKSLHREKLIFFDHETQSWNWDFEEIKAKNITDNVLELIIKRIKILPENTLYILKKAACLGNRFSFEKLRKISEFNEKEFYQYLWKAVKEGIIIPVGNTSRENSFLSNSLYSGSPPDLIFQHDKVQQAAYELINKNEILSFHLDIGKKLLDVFTEEDLEKSIFEIVNHLNIGSSLVTDNKEQTELAELNFAAGIESKSASAYNRALSYFEKSSDLVSKTENISPEFKKLLMKELAETKYLCGDFKGSKEILLNLVEQTKDIIEKCGIYELLILIYTMQAKYDEAVSTGQKTLQLLNVDLNLDNIESKASEEINKAIKNIKRSDIKDLINNKEMTDPFIKTAMKILIRLQATSYFFKAELYPLILGKMVNFSIEYGHTAESAKGYASFANIYASKTEELKTAYQIGKLGIDLSKKFKNKKIECQSRLSIAAFLIHGVAHLKKGEKHIRKGYQAGLESGEIQYAGLILFNKVHNKFFQGETLPQLEQEIPDDLGFCIKTGNHIGIDVITPFKLAANCLKNKTFVDFSDNEMSETKYIDRFRQNKSFFGIMLFSFLKGICFFIHEQYIEALTELKKTESFIKSSLGYFSEVEFYVFKALVKAALYENFSIQEQKDIIEETEKISQWLFHRSASAPENYLPRYFIVEAEIQRIKENNDKAARLYDEAVESAEKYNYIQFAAISNELCAKFWTNLNKPKLSRPYYEDALEAYRKWGAFGKVKNLEKIIPKTGIQYEKLPASLSNTTSSDFDDSEYDYSAALDMESIAQTSRVISGEVDLEKLLKKLIKIMIESAGAEKGYILLKSKDNSPTIEASASTDSEKIDVLKSLPVNEYPYIAETVVRYVLHTDEDVVINDCSNSSRFTNDSWIGQNNVKSLLCTPLKYKDKTTGVLYLENSFATNIFSNERLKILKNLLPQAAISIDNAILFTESAKLTKKLEKEIEFRKQIQTDLEKSEKKYREIFENTRDIYIETAIDGTVLEVSPSINEVSEYTRDSIIGTKVDHNYINPDDQKVLMDNLFKYGKVSNFEARCKTKKGREVDSSINAMLVKDEGGTPEKVIVSIRDITEKKQLELKLFNAQKMEAIGTLAGGIAHDFNNILAGITGYTDIALMKYNKEPEKIPQYLEGISKASERAKNLVSQILSFSRSSDTETKRINPLPVIREALKLLRSSTPSSIEMEQNIYLKSALIYGNSTQVHQIIMNLCANSAHAMKKEGGKLTVNINTAEIKNSDIIESAQGLLIPEGNYLYISVKDTGHGIPYKIQKKIFDPYFTTKKTGEGTGLGLAMVQGIIQNHSGYLTFSSEPNKGTTFNIYIPLIPETSKQKDITLPDQKKKGFEKILFVDDEETLVSVITDLLKDLGYKIEGFCNPAEALNNFNKDPHSFDLIISDMTMPVMTGDKLVSEIYKKRPDIPVIICTGFAESVTEKKIKKLGIKKTMIKPFNITELNNEIREILDDK